MAQVRPRSPTDDDAHHKRLKTTHTPNEDVVGDFATGLFDVSNVEQLRTSYTDSTPFKHLVVDTLFRDDLLRGVVREVNEHLEFTKKETDIYKVWHRVARNQTNPSLSLGIPNGRPRLSFLPLGRPTGSLPEPHRCP